MGNKGRVAQEVCSDRLCFAAWDAAALMLSSHLLLPSPPTLALAASCKCQDIAPSERVLHRVAQPFFYQ